MTCSSKREKGTRCKPALNRVPVLLALVAFAAGCGPSAETGKKEYEPSSPKESLYEAGHKLYLQLQYDSAQVLLNRVLSLDPAYTPALADLASLKYDLAMRMENGKAKNDLLRASRDHYVRLESFGVSDADTYERLCEIANALNDDKTFLKYAKKNAATYPYDRQYYNLTVAYFNVEDYASVIQVCKTAIDKFPSSPFIGTFYRQLGRGYMKVDRDQTAEKTFYSGLAVIEKRLAELRKKVEADASSADYQRMVEDKLGILTSLKYLHTTYKAMSKLADVEKQLKELGR